MATYPRIPLVPTRPASACRALAIILPVWLAPSSEAQSVADRTPNLTAGWQAPPGVLQFNFIHRFEVSGPPLRKVTNYPTFTVAASPISRLTAGINYGPNSTLTPSFPNEWEFFGRGLVTDQSGPLGLRVSLQTGYNVSSEALSSELSVSRTVGPVSLVGAGRSFVLPGDERWAAAGGAVVRLTSWMGVSGDVATMVDRDAGERVAWGAGIQLGIPGTPHSFSLQASNVNTVTIHGSSVGTRTRYGFEYTVPINLNRFGNDRDSEPVVFGAATDTVHMTIQNLAFQTPNITVAPGTVVVWHNQDPLAHTVTSDGQLFNSGNIAPDESWAMRFDDPGDFEYHCTPHPFMTGVVHVRES